MEELKGRTAVVTGGASGIGAAVVDELRAAGARPLVWDLAPGDDGIRCDVADASEVAAAMRETVARARTPTLLVTSAGLGGFGPVADMDLDEWHRILEVNLTGTMLCLRAAARSMLDAGLGGAVVCISSVNGRIPDRGMAAYCCSKAAVDMLVRVAAAELAPSGIRVNAVAPGVTDTPLFSGSAGRIPGFVDAVSSRTAMGRTGTADEVAELVVGLLRTRWVTGESVAADGGLSLHSPIDPWGAIPGEGRGGGGDQT